MESGTVRLEALPRSLITPDGLGKVVPGLVGLSVSMASLMLVLAGSLWGRGQAPSPAWWPCARCPGVGPSLSVDARGGTTLAFFCLIALCIILSGKVLFRVKYIISTFFDEYLKSSESVQIRPQ